MSGITMGYGYVVLHTEMRMLRKTADAISGWIMRLYLEFPEVYNALIIAYGREEVVTDSLALEILQSSEAPVELLSASNTVATPARLVIRAMLALSISGEPQCPYPDF